MTNRFFISIHLLKTVVDVNTLCKEERLKSKILIGQLFAGGAARSFSIFPLRVVYMPVDKREIPASILISVPKKRFKRAVKRNRVKRQVREAYRQNKHELLQRLEGREHGLAIAFLYLSDELLPTSRIEEIMKTLLSRIGEKLS